MVPVPDPAAFKRRRVLNYVVLGASYAAYYMARYNLGIADKAIGDQFGFNAAKMGDLKAIGKGIYGASALFNGPLADRLGGKRTLRYGMLGASFGGLLFAACGILPRGGSQVFVLLAVAWAINNYFQSYGALSIIKVNAAWFQVHERGRFSGIFGGMIQSGRLIVLSIGSLAMGYHLHWPWLFAVPAVILLGFHALAGRFIEDTPYAAGHPEFTVVEGEVLAPRASGMIPRETASPLGEILRKVFTNRAMLTIAAAEFCTGFVRNGTDDWFPRYMQEIHHVSLRQGSFLMTTVAQPVFAVAGGLLCGWVSDRYFQARRAPVAMLAYLGQAACMVALSSAGSVAGAGLVLAANSFCVQGTHGLLTGVASMDFGGKKAAATAAGFFDACQYAAGAVGGFAIGRLVSQSGGWAKWPPLLVVFAVVGAVLMATLWNAKPGRHGH